ncbi:Tubulin polyglutamylase TTLL7 [Triplophysa tibetana]|uniref:Tubulin polyglutamylase TTLL7 n=1 Tax=Triplophysa tibetana TaxID=1572043 RepID=A0A5A9NGM3_9TELE|nr:Tubulin polyglutamylase TTLL7 [Triplophysa tibetana]
MPSPPNDGEDQGTSPVNVTPALSNQNGVNRKVHTKKKKKGFITANVTGTKYEIVRVVMDEVTFHKVREDDETANLIWNDSAVQHEKIAELRNYQRINHFPGMGEICRKDCLARNMAKMIKSQPQEYSFIPKTWIFPAEYTQFQNYVKELKRKRKQKTFIVKPANGAMGHGISLIRNCEKLPVRDHFIVQEYLEKPFLMEGYKFDLRFYILVTSCDPLRVFLYNDGLVRMGTEKYHAPSESNLNQLYMHLTNYSVNKHNENFERDETVNKGSKRSIGWFTEFLRTNNYDVAKFWGDVSELVVKTLIVAEPHVLHAYRMCRPGQPPGSASVCFEVLGFDIILDRKLKPWLLEDSRVADLDEASFLLCEMGHLQGICPARGDVARPGELRKREADQLALLRLLLLRLRLINRAPSFGTDQKIDYDVKKGVLHNTLKLLNIRASDKRRNLAQQKAEAQRRLYGQGSMRKPTAGSSEWEKQRHLLERRREELEEDILDLLEQCELDDEKLMGKTCKQKGPKALSSMPESSPSPRGHRDPEDSSGSCSDSSSGSDADGEDESNSITQEKLNTPERSGRVHWKPAPKPQRGPSSSSNLSGLIRRSMSCPRSISSLTAQSPTNETRRPKTATHMANGPTAASQTAPAVMPMTPARPDTASRSQSLSRNTSANRGETLLSKEQEAELMQQTLAALREMRIRYPGKSEEEAEAVLDEILNNWKYHKPMVASYWLVKLDATKQRKVLDIIRTSIRQVLQGIWNEVDVESLRLYRLLNRVFNRLLWSHGQGMWNCLSSSGRSSWQSVFSKSSEVLSSQELRCCQRVVQLCRDCLLVVYKFVADSRGSLSGLSLDWDDTSHNSSSPHPVISPSWLPPLHPPSEPTSALPYR